MLVEAHCKGNGGTARSWRNAAVFNEGDGAIGEAVGADAEQAGDAAGLSD